MTFGTQRKFDKLNMLLGNSFGNLRNDILRINQRIDQIEAILANSNIGVIRDFMACQEKEIEAIKQMIVDASQPAAQEQPAESPVKITAVQFEADAASKGNPNGEWIELEGHNTNLTGWSLHDNDSKHVYSFPEGFVLNGKIRIFSGKGRNSSRRLYWNNPASIWNDNEDVASLVDPNGSIVSQVRSARVHDFQVLA